MKKFKIRIEKLDAMRVVVFRGYSTKPEMEAHQLAVAFAKERGLVDDHNRVETFGFNKPAPWVTSDDEYGYELWVVVEDETDVPPYLPVKSFPGATCAVTRSRNWQTSARPGSICINGLGIIRRMITPTWTGWSRY